MAPKAPQKQKPSLPNKKRKHISSSTQPKHGGGGGGEQQQLHKKRKTTSSSNPNPKSTTTTKPKPPHKFVAGGGGSATAAMPKTKRELRIQAKELSQARKKKRKPHYTLEQELGRLWEKMRLRNITREDRSKFISEALSKMKGKIPEIASSHIASRVLQTCVKHCSKDERDAVFEELRPHFLTLARNTYAVFLVMKMLDNASKQQLADFISSLHGHVGILLRHMVGSIVVEHAYQLGNAAQKQALLSELYSTELQLFKDLVSTKESRLVDIISKLQLQKSSVLRHMSSVIQPILEKGILDHSIIHKALTEYLSIADRSSAADVLKQLSGPLLPRMIHTKYGSRIGVLCVKYGNAKERKKIIKGMKGHVSKTARDRYGSLVLVSILSIVDDTKLTKKVIIKELQTVLKDLVLEKEKHKRYPLMQLLHPNCSRYFSPDDLDLLDSSIPSFQTEEVDEHTKSSEVKAEDDDDSDVEETLLDENASPHCSELLEDSGKKDPLTRRRELLVDSGLAKSLIKICSDNVEELLKSAHGKEVVYEVATGGAGKILHPVLDENLNLLHEAIASKAGLPKSGPEEDHLLENFHSSRTIRKLVLDCPEFASTLWETALKGNCEKWVQGHSCKVVQAFLESPDPSVRELAKDELKPLIDSCVLKVPEAK